MPRSADPADWVDREIASLRQSVERAAPHEEEPERRADGAADRPKLHVVPDLDSDAGDGARIDVLERRRPPFRVRSRARRFLRRHQFDILFYALSIALTLVVVLLALSAGNS